MLPSIQEKKKCGVCKEVLSRWQFEKVYAYEKLHRSCVSCRLRKSRKAHEDMGPSQDKMRRDVQGKKYSAQYLYIYQKAFADQIYRKQMGIEESEAKHFIKKWEEGIE